MLHTLLLLNTHENKNVGPLFRGVWKIPFNLQAFKSSGLALGGARPTLFKVDLPTIPGAIGTATAQVQFLCRAAQVPPAPLDSIPVPYFGRKIQYAGDRDFPPWTVTIMNDDDWALRTAIEGWSNLINPMISNRMDPSVFPTGYKQTALVTQYDKTGNPISVYQFVGIFPTNVDAIQLDWDGTNQIEQFDVTFAYDWWQPDSSVNRGPSDFTGLVAGDGTST